MNVYLIPLLFAGVVALIQGTFIFSRRRELDSPALVPFLGVAVAATLWALGYAFQLTQTSQQWFVFWGIIVLAGVVLMSISWPLFVFRYTGWIHRLDGLRVVLFAALPILSFVGVLTNNYHGLVYENSGFDATGTIPVLTADPGPLLILFLVYTFILDIVAAGALLRYAWIKSGADRRQSILLLVAGVIPFIVSFLTASGFVTSTPVDLTPVSFAFTTVVIGWALYHYRFLDLGSIGRNRVIEEMEDAMVVLDTSHEVVDLNPAATALFDTTKTASIGAPFEAVWPAGSTQMAEVSDGTSEVIIESVDSTQFFDVSISHINAGHEEPVGCVVHISDITERHTAQRRFQALIEKTTNVVAIIDEEGVITYVSPSLADVLGYDPERACGINIFDIIHPDDRKETYTAFTKGKQTDQTPLVEYRIQHQDGSWRHIESVGENHFDDPAIQGMVVSVREITEKKLDQQRLEVLNRVLRHDLRNDLTVIDGYTSLVRETIEDPELEHYLSIVLNKSRELTDLSNHARQIEKTIRAGKTATVTNVSILVNQHVTETSASNPEVELTTEIQPETYALAGRLLPVAFDNLMENALKHSDEETPEICVTVESVSEQGAQYVDIRVADNGPGIPESERRALETGTETPLEHANGIGLWLVHWVATQMEGELQIRDNEPKGSIVTLRLLHAVPESERAGSEKQTDGSSGLQYNTDSKAFEAK
ncbi:histidine kinase N-terminal 7TM domain-containing protein [Haloferax sp. DFSO60]|uniref:histidine kinase N-terminal 7TM domain-containing protein n=1 Tax=Haloferax sp. DFSO60 TaxID=3388652 RepID=UPI0039784736